MRCSVVRTEYKEESGIVKKFSIRVHCYSITKTDYLTFKRITGEAEERSVNFPRYTWPDQVTKFELFDGDGFRCGIGYSFASPAEEKFIYRHGVMLASKRAIRNSKMEDAIMAHLTNVVEKTFNKQNQRVDPVNGC